MAEQICRNCIWLHHFTPRDIEPSGMECKHPTWGGVYVIDASVCNCLGSSNGRKYPIAFSPAPTGTQEGQ